MAALDDAPPLFIPNVMPAQTLSSSPSDLLKQCLEQLLTEFPPKDEYEESQTEGLIAGYTGLAFMLLQLHRLHPGLHALDHDLLYWAQRYLDGRREEVESNSMRGCGVVNETLCYTATRAMVSKSQKDVDKFLENIPELIIDQPEGEKDPYPTELLYGRTGALYLLRAMRRYIPNSATSLEKPTSQLLEKILNTDSDGKGNWEWQGNRFYGAAHGDIGIIVQLVLTDASLAPRLKYRVEELLGLQGPDGNFPSSRDMDDEEKNWSRVQYCHGAPGFVLALQTLQPFYPELQDKIDKVIEKAREKTWEYGILTKDPNLCHGIMGNSFAFPPGPKRDHFLALCTQEAVEKQRELDPRMFQPASYGLELSITLQYLPSAVWTWAVCGMEKPPMLLFNDV